MTSCPVNLVRHVPSHGTARAASLDCRFVDLINLILYLSHYSTCAPLRSHLRRFGQADFTYSYNSSAMLLDTVLLFETMQSLCFNISFAAQYTFSLAKTRTYSIGQVPTGARNIILQDTERTFLSRWCLENLAHPHALSSHLPNLQDKR